MSAPDAGGDTPGRRAQWALLPEGARRGGSRHDAQAGVCAQGAWGAGTQEGTAERAWGVGGACRCVHAGGQREDWAGVAKVVCLRGSAPLAAVLTKTGRGDKRGALGIPDTRPSETSYTDIKK